MIHQTAIIDSQAKVATHVSIGPWTLIGPEVEIAEGTEIGSHVIIKGPTRIGRENKIFHSACIGEIPQDMKFKGERTYLHIGDRNIIREFCTIHRGTNQDQATTYIGHDNLLMAYVHIAHDCVVGNYNIFANNASLAGHVIVEDYVGLGGFSGVLQFCRIGAYSFLAANSMVIKDVPPFLRVSGYYAKPFGLNRVGLQRQHFSSTVIAELRAAYRIIYRSGLTLIQALDQLKKSHLDEIKRLVQFISTSRTGIVR